MKTLEEIADDLEEAIQGGDASDVQDVIEAVRLDAFKAGMMHAKYLEEVEGPAYCSISDAANKLTELPK